MPYKNKQKQNEYRRNRVKGRRKAYLADKKCAHCSATTKLEIDHVDPSEKKSHRIWDWSQERIEEELSKCQILCTTCHRIKTYVQNNAQAQHGSQGMYNKGCRCVLCKKTNAARVRAWRKKSS